MKLTTLKRKRISTVPSLTLAVVLFLILAPSLFTRASSASSDHKQGIGSRAELGSARSEFEPASPQPDEIGTHHVAGQLLTATELPRVNFQASRITSCGQGVIYLSREDGTLWVNLRGGIGTWKKVVNGTMGRRIACDRRHLYSLDANGILYHANTLSDGQLGTINQNDHSETRVWTNNVDVGKNRTVPAGTDEIAGGMGNIYALAFNQSTKVGTLYSSQLANPTSPDGYVQGASDSWVQLANNLGTSLVSGAGSKAMFTSYTTSLGYRKTNRTFGANPDNTLYYTDGLLDGVNSWTSFHNVGQEILSIAADDSNTLYVLTRVNSMKHLLRFSFEEENCTDHLDNDANGQIDTEDAKCRASLATTWCQSHTGSSCIDRIHSDSNGYSHALVTCNSGGQPPIIEAGLCTKVSPGADKLTEPRANPEPSGAGHYCNVIMPDGTWDFEFAGARPCDRLARLHPGGKIVRAGIYSTNGLNDVNVRCTNGHWTKEGEGTAILTEADNAVSHTSNRCVFTVSPKAMRVFNAPFPTSVWGDPVFGNRGYSVGHVFDHVPRCQPNDPGCPCLLRDCPVNLESFGNGEVALSSWLDNRGRNVTTYQKDQTAYDFIINEGTPLRALGYGVVVKSRDRDLASYAGRGTTYQGEIYIRYDVGSDPVYAESFVAYYAHLGKRSVVDGQTVEPGQLIGYSGTTGFSSAPHVHFGLIRLSNTNGHDLTAGEAFGYHIPFRALLNDIGFNWEALPGQVDPYGWRAGGIDPTGYRWSNAKSPLSGLVGMGAWSPQMWIPGEVPPYPPTH